MKVEDILEVLTFNNCVCIFEFNNGFISNPGDDDINVFYDGPSELVPFSLYNHTIKFLFVLDNVLHISI